MPQQLPASGWVSAPNDERYRRPGFVVTSDLDQSLIKTVRHPTAMEDRERARFLEIGMLVLGISVLAVIAYSYFMQ